jgi:glycosyltransferase involved in cell wall biosynthesis
MACGLPVIGADSPGIRELIVHGETGWLCGLDAKSIREAILYLLARPDLRAELGRNARRYVVENLSLERIVEMELALLREVAGQ